MNKLCLSIDFDFFIEEDRALDMGHGETSLFLNAMWDIRSRQFKIVDSAAVEDGRLDWREKMPMRNSIQDMFKCVHKNFEITRKTQAASAESHAALGHWLKENENVYDIVNFDAHHDINYGRSLDVLKQKFDCGDWAGHLMLNKRIDNYTQVYPEWRKKFPENHETDQHALRRRFGDRVKFAHFDSFMLLKPRKVDRIFLCRSGCWVPPCYDKQFNELSRFFGLGPIEERKI